MFVQPVEAPVYQEFNSIYDYIKIILKCMIQNQL